MKVIYKKYFRTAALVWAGCFVLFLLANIFVLAPQRKDKKRIKRQLNEKKQMYRSILQATQEKNKIQLNEEVDLLRHKLNDFVTDYRDSANLTLDISEIAKEKNVSSFSIRTVGKREGSAIPNCNHIRENHIDISFTSGFNRFAAFLNALERYQPVIFVDKFTITRASYDNLGHRVRMDLAIFVRKQQDS